MVQQDIRPPIPARLVHRPTVGGLVAPWVNVRLADGGVDFRSTHRATWEKCWRQRRCQVCSEPLTSPMVLLCGPNQLKDRVFDEPPVHPECAFYAQKACPMVAGRMSNYAARENVAAGRRGKTCPDPGCDCGGWVTDDGTPHHGDPSHTWYAVWVTGYQIAVRPDGKLFGGGIDDNQLLRVRVVSNPVEVG